MSHTKLLLAVWREACQHIEIGAASQGIYALLRAQMPLAELWLYRVAPQHQLVARVASWPAGSAAHPTGPHEPRPPEIEKLARWIRRGAVAATGTVGRLPAALAALGDIPGHDLRAAPLSHGADTLGVALFAAAADKAFTQSHEALLHELREPLAVALSNDARLHELAALREAAEADRRSLLRRLGRTDLSEQIIGAEHGLRQVMQRVQVVGQSDAPVLLLGETGAGKEVVARAIHDRSGRSQGPFLRVNCGAIPSELIDSQLFGHEKGAFTGAGDRRRGWFERADGGTLFLDEIGELPLEAQVRFLRVLQDGMVERVGGDDATHVDVRVVAATHRDLAGMVQSGRFREDLWYRIAVFPILIPPLRDRPDDIGPLAEHFASRAAHRFGVAPVAPSDDDVALLRAYSWPGNVRELAAVIDRAAILGEGQTLEVEASLGFPAQLGVRDRGGGRPVSTQPLPTLDDAVRAHIRAALRATKGRVEGAGGAARLLDINPHTLRARMRRLGIVWADFRAE